MAPNGAHEEHSRKQLMRVVHSQQPTKAIIASYCGALLMRASVRGALLLALIIPLACHAAVEAPIKILYISRAGIWHQTMAQDPAISTFWIPVPGHSHIELLGQDPSVLHRIMRIYMPRRVEDLVRDYDMIILQECPYSSLAYESLWFKDSWVKMFVDAIAKHGISFEMWGGDASYGGGGEGFYTSWGDTMLGPLLPVECLGGYNYQSATPQRVRFRNEEHPLARLPWDSSPPIELNNPVQMKEGGNLIAEVVHGDTRWPYIFDWEYGKGFIVGETQVVHSLDTLNLMISYWDYFPDFVTYLAYHGAGREIPENVIMVKRIRNQIQRHFAERSMIISVFDFAEKFGADVSQAYEDIEKIDTAHELAEGLFIEKEYQATSDALDEIQNMWEQVAGKATGLKDRALFWVYVVEYLVVTGTAMVSGVVLWSVMIRRRLYRRMVTTRLERQGV